MKKTFKNLVAGASAVTLVAALGLASCGGGNAASSEDKTITVAASPTPHAQILNEAVAPVLEKDGWTLEVKEFNDYVQPNTVVDEKEIDANYFQHITYLDQFCEENGTNLVSAGAVHYEPFAIYAGKVSSIDDLKKGDLVAVPNDTTNEARALLLLEQAGLIKLKEGAGLTATPKDIAENPKELKFKELEAAQLPKSLEDVTVACINANYALEAGLNAQKDGLVVEASDGAAAVAYANIIAVHADNENSEKTKALVKACGSQEVKDYIAKTFDGAVVAL
ncbi:MAG: MetQ/NlpA family ABC transporter substrate-binding protein [Coriobacteriia bacterium]|nr:MetQ/NlpA family ABC transporter substrate-binding protein [Coriobacteriia bacterium]